jgi:hypothetical protein
MTTTTEEQQAPGLALVPRSDDTSEPGEPIDATGWAEWEEEMPEKPTPRPVFRVIDGNTGELQQLTLLGAQWADYRVEAINWSISGSDSEVKSSFDDRVEGELEPGSIVRIEATGVVKEHAPIFKKDTHQGKTVIHLENLQAITVIGHAGGRAVEAARNVDDELKDE